MPSPLRNRRNKILILSFWLICIVAHYLVLLQYDISRESALTDSTLSNFLMAGVSVLFVSTMEFYRPRSTQYFYFIIWCAALTAISACFSKYALEFLLEDDRNYIELLEKSLPVRLSINFLVVAGSAAISTLWYNLEDQKKLESRRADAEKLSRDAELYKLRQQLQPHFLFNSLNSISALAGSQPEQARKMIQQLSDFLRGALKKEDYLWIALEDEISHLSLYLEMEKMRFGHRLSTEIKMDSKAASIQVPPMLLQPIVENAIKFGLYDTTEAAKISISVNTFSDFLQVDVCNPFDPETSSPRAGTGFGLTSVRRRLFLVFSRNDLLTTEARDATFITTVKIPLHDFRHIDR